MPKALLIANQRHLSSDIPGGVQICTSEYILLFEKAGFEIIPFPVQSTKRFSDRIKIKSGIDSYNVYDYKPYIKQIVKILDEEKIEFVIINQVNLFKFARVLKKESVNQIKIICWSHGNESGDFLHSLVKEKMLPLRKWLNIIKLGRLLYLESVYFSTYIDYMFTVSETEKHINSWLGSKKAFFVPRLFNPSFLKRNPIPGVFGFVGTLNHPPNRIGLELLCNEIVKLKADITIRVVGKPQKFGKYLEDKYPFVEYIGYLNDLQLEDEVKTWLFFLNPVFWYSRGVTTKLAYAINYGIPIISTTEGNRGYQWSDGTIKTVESPMEMAEAMVIANDEFDFYEQQIKNVASSGPNIDELANSISLLFSKYS